MPAQAPRASGACRCTIVDDTACPLNRDRPKQIEPIPNMSDSSLQVQAAALSARRNKIELLSVVMPAYNEAANLAVLLPTLQQALQNQAEALELVVVDDGSTDETAMVVHAAIAKGLPARLIRLSRNFGKEAALSAGLDLAEGDVVVCIDSDGQHPLDAVLEMIEQWRAGYDVVYGVQTDRRHSQSSTRRGLTRLFYWLMQMGTRVEMPANAGDFRLLDRCVVQALRRLPERARYMKGLFAWVGFSSVGVPYVPHSRLHGETHFKFKRLFSLAITAMTAFTHVPLRMVTALGLLVSVLAVIFGIWVIFETLVFGNKVSGYATVVVSIVFLAGVQLLCLGIIGEYLGRVFDEVKQRPLYLTREVTPPLQRAAAGDSAGPR